MAAVTPSASKPGVTGANNSPVGAAGQPSNAALKKAIAERMSRNQQRKKGFL